ncbi:unnamed protein product [Penicillium salamii]|nr:unnamed protein product [Penicillium salamii]
MILSLAPFWATRTAPPPVADTRIRVPRCFCSLPFPLFGPPLPLGVLPPPPPPPCVTDHLRGLLRELLDSLNFGSVGIKAIN